MKGLLAVLSLFLVIQAACGLSTVPLFSWSGPATSSSSVEVISRSIRSQELQNKLANVISQQQPEIVVAVIADEMSTAQFSQLAGAFNQAQAPLSFIKNNINAASVSLSAPYTVPLLHSPLSSSLSALVSRVSPNAQSVSFNVVDESDVEQVLAWLDAHEELLSNGVVDVVVIKVQSASEAGSVLSKLTEKLSAAQYLAIFSADSAPSMQTTFAVDAEPAFTFLQSGLAANATVLEGPQYIYPDVLIALIIFIPLIFLLIFAVQCMMSIQAPVRFATTKIVIGKEY